MVTDLLAFVASGGGGLPLIGGGVIGFGAGYILKKIAKILAHLFSRFSIASRRLLFLAPFIEE